MSLDDRLREIINPITDDFVQEKERQEAIAAIKQAFRDAGYIKHPISIRDDPLIEPHQQCLPGREWYQKLAKHLDTYAWSRDEKDSILQAAFEVAEGLDGLPDNPEKGEG